MAFSIIGVISTVVVIVLAVAGAPVKQDKLIEAQYPTLKVQNRIMEDGNNIFGILREADPKRKLEHIRSLTFVMWERASKGKKLLSQYLNDGYKVLDDEYSKGRLDEKISRAKQPRTDLPTSKLGLSAKR